MNRVDISKISALEHNTRIVSNIGLNYWHGLLTIFLVICYRLRVYGQSGWQMVGKGRDNRHLADVETIISTRFITPTSIIELSGCFAR